MRKLLGLLLSGMVGAGGAAAHAQWVVHAASGTLKAVSASGAYMTLAMEDGTMRTFKLPEDGKKPVMVDFDPGVRSQTVPAATFHNVGAHLMVFYYGLGPDATALSVRDLGDGPVAVVNGTVQKFDKHEHTLLMRGTDGKDVTLHVEPNAVIDTGDGLKPGAKFSPGHGDAVRIITSGADDSRKAVLVQKPLD